MWSLLKQTTAFGVAALTFDGKIVRCNEKFGEMHGDEPEQICGRNEIELTCHEDRDRARASLYLLESEKTSVQYDKKNLSRSGSVDVRCQYLAFRGGKTPMILVFVYERDSENHVARITQLEEYVSRLIEVIGQTQGVQVNMTGTNSSQNADHGAQISNSSTVNQSKVVITLIIAGATCLIALAALVFSGSVSLSGGGKSLEIQGNAGSPVVRPELPTKVTEETTN